MPATTKWNLPSRLNFQGFGESMPVTLPVASHPQAGWWRIESIPHRSKWRTALLSWGFQRDPSLKAPPLPPWYSRAGRGLPYCCFNFENCNNHNAAALTIPTHMHMHDNRGGWCACVCLCLCLCGCICLHDK